MCSKSIKLLEARAFFVKYDINVENALEDYIIFKVAYENYKLDQSKIVKLNYVPPKNVDVDIAEHWKELILQLDSYKPHRCCNIIAGAKIYRQEEISKKEEYPGIQWLFKHWNT